MSGGPVPSPITPNLTTYSGTPTNLVTGLETVPSDFPVAVIHFTTNVSMVGLTSIQAGSYVGQRLLTMPSNTSNGSVEWIIHGTSPEAPVLSPIIQSAFGTICEVIDWVWDGFRWNLVSVFNPANGPIDGDTINGDIVNLDSLGIGSNIATEITSGSPATTNVAGTSRIEYNLLGTDLDYASTVPFDHGFDSIPIGKLLLVHNILDNTFPNDDSLVHLYDHNFAASNSTLYLATPKVTLRKREWLLLQFHSTLSGDGWYEIARSRRDAIFNPTDPTLTNYDIRGASTVKMLFTAPTSFDLNTVTPSFSDGTFAEFYDGQELLLINDPQSDAGSTINLDDEGTTPGVLVRLTTASVSLTPGDSIRLRYDLGTTTWYEVQRSILV